MKFLRIYFDLAKEMGGQRGIISSLAMNPVIEGTYAAGSYTSTSKQNFLMFSYLP